MTVIVVVSVLVACSGQESSTTLVSPAVAVETSETTTAPAATPAAPAETAATAPVTTAGPAPESTIPPESTAPPATTPTTVAAPVPPSASTATTLCQYTKELERSGEFNQFDAVDEFTKSAATLGEVRRLLDEMAKRAPVNLKADFANYAKWIDSLRALYAKYGNDLVKVLEAVRKDPDVVEEFSTGNEPAIERSITKIETYFEDVCKIK